MLVISIVILSAGKPNDTKQSHESPQDVAKHDENLIQLQQALLPLEESYVYVPMDTVTNILLCYKQCSKVKVTL